MLTNIVFLSIFVVLSEATKEENIIIKKENILSLNEHSLSGSNILYGLLKLSYDNHVSEKCSQDLDLVYNGIQRRKIWALRALDASARVESGFQWRNNFWLGSRQICNTFKVPHSIYMSTVYPRKNPNLANATSPIDIDYRLIYVSYSNDWQIVPEFALVMDILHIGLCLPTSCTNDEIGNLTQIYFDSNTLDISLLFELKPIVTNVKDLNVKTNFLKKTSVQWLGSYIVVTILLTIVAAKIKSKSSIQTDNTKESSQIEKYIKCFSLEENWNRFCNPPTSKLPSLSFFRFYGSIVVIVFHVNHFALHAVKNSALFYAYLEQFLFPWSLVTLFIVDLFFVISGFLVAYSFFKDTKSLDKIKVNSIMGNIRMILNKVFKRYLRFTPILLIMVGLQEITSSYSFETTPFATPRRTDLTCRKYWWRNILYIQNFFSVPEYCMLHSWSLAADMQYYIIFLVLMTIFVINEKSGKILYFSVIIGMTSFNYMLAMSKEYVTAFDISYETLEILYLGPNARIVSYALGIGSGWLYTELNGKLLVKPIWLPLLWILAICCFFATNFGLLPREWVAGIYHGAAMMTIYRVIFCLSICFMIIVSQGDNAKWLQKAGQFKLIDLQNQLGYAFYLVNPWLIEVIHNYSYESLNIDEVLTVIMFVAVVVITNFLSVLLTLFFEIPYGRIASEMDKNTKLKKK